MNSELLTKLNRSAYVPHLTIRESLVPPGGEWMPKLPGWALVQVAAGSGYWMGLEVNQELAPGAVLLLSALVRGNIRASSLGGLRLQVFPVEPARLTGLISLGEQRFLETAAVKAEFSQLIFSPCSPIATRMKELCAGGSQGGALFRLQLLQLFIEIFDKAMKSHLAAPGASPDAKQRLQNFLRRTPASELLDLSFAELAQHMGCTPRHLNRIFQEAVGMSFRDKRTELRLARACELLATTESKVVDVALESGYESLSLFNLMFAAAFRHQSRQMATDALR